MTDLKNFSLKYEKYENMKKNEKKKKMRVGGEGRRKNLLDFCASYCKNWPLIGNRISYKKNGGWLCPAKFYQAVFPTWANVVVLLVE